MVQLVLLIGFAAAAIVAGALRPRIAASAAAVAALAACGTISISWASGTGLLLDVPWLPSLSSRFRLALDQLGSPIAVFVTAVAVPVFAFSRRYLPHHLEKEGRDARGVARFTALMLGFMLSMVLLILAHDLLIIFIALELTALMSFFLIRFDEEKPEARRAALVALVATAGSSLLFLIGVLMVATQAGTTVLADLEMAGEAATVSPIAATCLIAGVLGKSAQVPLHFWLPRAMVAPTPVSAYLHSAAVVAAGVFVLQRLRFLLEAEPVLLQGLFWFAFISIGIGGVLALVSDEFKRILAYSTVAQYGYAVALIGAGGADGAVGAAFFLIAHGAAKCALFLTAGAATEATGWDRLSQSGGLARRMPLLAVASGLAAAGLAGLPLTIGYFKDDLLLKAALDQGPAAATLATAAIALTLAYTARFWFGIFGGAARKGPGADPGLSWPIAALAAFVLVGGVWVAPLEPVFVAAGGWIARKPLSLHLSYHLEPSPVLWLTLAAWAMGGALAVASGGVEKRITRSVAWLARWAGPDAWADRLARAGSRLSNELHRLEVRDMRDRLTLILIPTAAFVLLGIASHGALPSAGTLRAEDLPLAASLVVVAAAALVVSTPLNHLSFVLLLSFVGFSLALSFVLSFAPAVALVLVLIETAFTLLFLAVLSQIRPGVLQKARRRIGAERGPLAGLTAGAVGTVAAWISLSALRRDAVAVEQVSLTERAHAKDVVTAILADFRGLDTAGELTVLVVALFGAAAIAWGRRI